MSTSLRTLLGAASVVALLASAGQALELEEARHLLLRTGFGGLPRELEALRPLTREQAVDRLLDGIRARPVVPFPGWIDEPPPGRAMRMAMRKGPRMLRKRFRETMRGRGEELKAWWYQEMLETDSPLTERLTLFWHGHFTSSLRKARWPPLMARQNLLLRRNAAGSFRAMLFQVSRDPAMILYLDNQSNVKGRPNENFARELLELFTMGEGRYTERDIREAARAFTGWKVDRRRGEFRKVARQHDDGLKTFMGRTGRLDGEDVLEVVLEQPEVAPYLVEKLWREFVGTEPDGEVVARLAADLRGSGYALRPTLRALLLTDAFWDPRTRGRKIKSPVELMVGVLRTLPVPIEDTRPLVQMGRRLGQDLLDPPNVKGWPGGPDWITSSTLLLRRQVLTRALRGLESEPAPPPLPGLDLEAMERVLLAVPALEPKPPGLEGWRAVRHLLLDPAYQVY